MPRLARGQLPQPCCLCPPCEKLLYKRNLMQVPRHRPFFWPMHEQPVFLQKGMFEGKAGKRCAVAASCVYGACFRSHLPCGRANCQERFLHTKWFVPRLGAVLRVLDSESKCDGQHTRETCGSAASAVPNPVTLSLSFPMLAAQGHNVTWVTEHTSRDCHPAVVYCWGPTNPKPATMSGPKQSNRKSGYVNAWAHFKKSP